MAAFHICSAMTEITAETDPQQTVVRDVRLVGLVSAAHGMSHFYGLVLPPIFPLLTDAFGVGYTEFGLLIALMSVASGVMQTPAGMLVDRLGAGPVLIFGLGLLSGAILLFGLAPGFWWLVPLSIAAGLGSCVFHPADYAIMNARVGASRLGRAYSAHSLAGNIGWIAAPASVLGLTALFGWRAALVILGGAGLLFTFYLVSQRAVLSEAPAAKRIAVADPARDDRAAAGVLLSAPILMCFTYFTLLSISLVGLQTFLPSALIAAFGVSIAAANGMLTAFLLAASLGVLIGGVVADRYRRHEVVVAIGLAGAAVFSLVLGVAVLSDTAVLLCASLVGLAVGSAGPARDMLVRGATPAGATGKVFGFVYSGLDLGGVIGSPVLGLLLDHGLPRLVFVVAAIALFGAIGTAVAVGNGATAARGDAADRPA